MGILSQIQVRAGLLGAFEKMILPDKCLGCNTYIHSDPPEADPLSSCFCSACLPLPLPLFDPPFCIRCGHLFDTGENHLCEKCLGSEQGINRVRAAFSYEGIVQTAVSLFKYKGRLSLAKALSFYLYQAYERFFGQEDIDYILPIPLYKARAWERGFNQSVLLVRSFPTLYKKGHGRGPAWEIDLRSLVRKRPTQSQTGLDQTLREKNLKNAFGLLSKEKFRGKQILLVDDVYTSGATCRAGAHTLLKAGAEQVDVLVLARA